MKLDEETLSVFSHVGEVAIVYDAHHKVLWSHPEHERIVPDDKPDTNVPGLRVWVNLGKIGGAKKEFRSGDYVFILTSNGPGPDKLYSEEEHSGLTSKVIDCILVSILEDVTTWGQVAFDEPYLSIVREIAEAANNNRLSISFSPDCVIHYNEKPQLGYST